MRPCGDLVTGEHVTGVWTFIPPGTLQVYRTTVINGFDAPTESAP